MSIKLFPCSNSTAIGKVPLHGRPLAVGPMYDIRVEVTLSVNIVGDLVLKTLFGQR